MKVTWRTTVLGLAAGIALAGAGSRVEAAVCGDLNGNGTLTIADCTQLFDVIAGPPDPAGLCGGQGAAQCGDLNADGAINIADGIICLNAVAGNETLFPLCTGSGVVPNCPGGARTVSTDINTTQRWPASCVVTIDGTLFVNQNVVLTIDAGTTIKGRKNSSNGSPSGLIFLRDSKINAAGTQASPIIFTSDQAVGARNKGDWGGLVLNGRAPVNVPGGEGLAEGLSNVPFGGSQPNDSSGVLRFVRIEFAGRQLTVDNELNLLTMNGVGAGTSIDHVHSHNGLDDCHEWFGGTVNAKFLVGTACGDDGFDWQLGYTGGVQFGLIAQNINVIESGGNGVEADNNENGFTLEPFSNPRFCNVTLIGTRGQAGTPAGANQVGLLLRRGTKGFVAKSIIEGFHSAGMQLQHATPACSNSSTLTGELLIRDSIFFDNGTSTTAHCSSGSGANAPSPCDGCQLYDMLAGSFNVRPDLSPPGPVVNPGVAETWPPNDPRPSNAGAVANAFDCSAVDGFFQATNYTGGFDPSAANWLTTPWVSFALN